MTFDDFLNYLIHIMPIIAPVLSCVWLMHNMDKRIAVLENAYKSSEEKLDQILLTFINNKR